MKKSIALLLAFAMVLCFVACQSTTTTDKPSVSQPTTAPKEETAKPVENTDGIPTELVIGSIQDLTGFSISQGIPIAKALEYYVDQINAAGGIDGKTKIKLVAYDTQADPTQGLTAYKRLCTEDKVSAVIGSHISGQGLAIAPETDVQKVPVVAIWIDPNCVTRDDGTIYDYSYIAQLTGIQQGNLEAKFASERLGHKKIGVMYAQDVAFGVTLANGFTQYCEANGIETVVETYNAADVDYTVQLMKLKSADVDCLYFPSYETAIQEAIRQARNLGITVDIVGCNSYFPQAFEAGKACENNVYFVQNADFNGEKVGTLAAEVLAATGVETCTQSFIAIDCLQVIIEAFRLCHSTDPAVLNEYITKVQVAGYQGDFSLSPEKHITAGLPLVFSTCPNVETKELVSEIFN